MLGSGTNIGMNEEQGEMGEMRKKSLSPLAF